MDKSLGCSVVPALTRGIEVRRKKPRAILSGTSTRLALLLHRKIISPQETMDGVLVSRLRRSRQNLNPARQQPHPTASRIRKCLTSLLSAALSPVEKTTSIRRAARGPTRAISVTAITVKLAVGGTVIERSIHPWRVVMKQLLAAALVGIVIGGIGLAAEAVFAKPISQRGAAMIPQAQSPHVHVLDPIIINGGA
jgi:hypothetical protein